MVCRVSELARIEFLSAIYRKLRNKEIDGSQLVVVLEDFERTWEALQVEPAGPGVFREASELLHRFGRTIGLRTLDALQLATFVLASEREWRIIARMTLWWRSVVNSATTFSTPWKAAHSEPESRSFKYRSSKEPERQVG